MSRIGFRRLLPILFTLVHVALLFYASAHQHNKLSSFHGQSAYRSVAYQENSVAWEPMAPKPMTPAQKLAILLNLPALLLAIPIAVMFFHGDDMGLLYASVPFVPLVWFGIGWWLDRLLGYIQHAYRRRRLWRGVFAVLSAGMLCLGIISITPINHHRTRDDYWVGSALVLWSGLFLAISVSGSIRRAPQLM